MLTLARRQVWDLLDAAKRERVMVLTTHSMEEADVLGDRIGIFAAGQLRCLGTSLVRGRGLGRRRGTSSCFCPLGVLRGHYSVVKRG